MISSSIPVAAAGLLDCISKLTVQEPAQLSAKTIFGQFACREGVVLSEGKKPSGLSASMLRCALDVIANPGSSSSFKIWKDQTGGAVASVRRVGEGTSAKVYAIFVLTTGQAGAFKVAREGKSNLDSLQNEAELLAKIHSQGSVIGIAPQAFSSLSLSVKKRSQEGFLYPCFTMDAFDYLSQEGSVVGQEEFHIRAYQLVSGMYHLHKHNILLGDVKLENVGIQGLKTFFSDFGSATQVTDSTPCEMIASGCGVRWAARATTTRLDFHAACLAKSSKNKQRAVDVEKARDVFGLGMVLYALMERGYPCPFDDEGYPILPVFCAVRKDISSTVRLLVRNMCHSQISVRWTIEKVFKSFDKYIRESWPEILEKVSKLYA